MSHVHAGGLIWFQVGLTVSLGITALLYVQGSLGLRAASSTLVPAWRVASFLAGLVLIWVAAGPPLATLEHQRLTVHMIQHLLLMSVAAPLIWLGAPVMPLLHALPWKFVTAIIGPLGCRKTVRRIGRTLARPAVCWMAATLTLVGWHVPAALALGLQSNAWHLVQQVTFLATGLLFWWPVVRPWPSTRTEPQWSMVLYLFLATLPCDALSGFLVFSERIAYPIYLSTTGHSAAAVLDDQMYAGALMWTAVTIIYLLAGTMISIRLLAVPPHGGRDQAVVEAAHS